jgi:hypothetical protein
VDVTSQYELAPPACGLVKRMLACIGDSRIVVAQVSSCKTPRYAVWTTENIQGITCSCEKHSAVCSGSHARMMQRPKPPSACPACHRQLRWGDSGSRPGLLHHQHQHSSCQDTHSRRDPSCQHDAAQHMSVCQHDNGSRFSEG